MIRQVSFPGFLGCVTAGADLDAARAMAEEALAFHVEGLAEEGEPLPGSSSLRLGSGEPRRGGDPGSAGRRAGQDRAGTLPEDALREIDAYAEAQGFTRSGFLLKAARRVLEGVQGNSELSP